MKAEEKLSRKIKWRQEKQEKMKTSKLNIEINKVKHLNI